MLQEKKSSLYKISSIYTNNELVDEEIRKNRPLTIASKNQIARNKFNKGGERPLQ